MKNRLLRFALPVLGLLTASLSAQQPAAPAADYHQMITVIRVTPGKSAEFVKFIGETSKKVAQLRANSGEIVSWSLLRAVYPSGKEAAGDYVITTLYKGVPPEPKSGSALDPVYKQAGVTMTSAEANVIRNSLSSAVTTEIWRVRQRVGAAAKGHYVLRNQMRVKDSSGYNSYVDSVSKPIAEGLVKKGALSAWSMANKLLPTGTDTAYTAYTVDVFPSWTAVFATLPYQAVVDQMSPGKSYQQVMGEASKFRDIGNRDLWLIEDYVVKSN